MRDREENYSMKELSARAARIQNVRLIGCIKLAVLYAVTLSLLYLGFWCGYYFFPQWWGVATAVALVAATSLVLAFYRKKTWSAILSCLSVSMGIGLSVSAFYVLLDVQPSRFFGMVLLLVLVYKIVQSLMMNRLKHKTTLTIVFIVFEIIAAIVFFASMTSDMGLYSQIGFALVVAIFLSFGQLALYKKGANEMWRTVALSYIIGFAFIVLFVVVLIISILAEDGSAFEIFSELSFGDEIPTKKKKGKLP